MKLLVLALVALIIAGIVVWNIGTKVVGDVVSNTQQGACTDTNPNNHEKLQGAVTYKTWYGMTKTAYDSCDTDDNAALQYRCDGKKIASERIPCTDGCNAAGTACQGAQWNTALLSLNAAFENAEPGDDLVFDGITPASNNNEQTTEANRLQLKVVAAPNATSLPVRSCVQFSLSSLGAKRFADNVLAETGAMPSPSSEESEETGADESGCYYVASPVLETLNAKEFHGTIETYVDGLFRLYDRYCTTKIASVPVRISACPLPRQESGEGAPETSAALKLTIRFGKK